MPTPFEAVVNEKPLRLHDIALCWGRDLYLGDKVEGGCGNRGLMSGIQYTWWDINVTLDLSMTVGGCFGVLMWKSTFGTPRSPEES